MSEPPVQQKVIVDTSDPEAKLNRVKALALEAVQKAKEARRKVMQQVSLALTSISSMMANFSMVMNLLGQQSDAFFSALIGMTLSTISMLISVSIALAATGVGAGAAAIIGAIAVALQTVVIAKLIVDKVHSSGLWQQITRASFAALAQHQRGQTQMGGAF